MKITLQCLALLSLLCTLPHTIFTDATSWKEQLKEKIALNNPPQWMKDQIKTDLKDFSGGITRSMIDQTRVYSRDVAHFKIVNGNVYSNRDNLVTHLGAGFSSGGAYHNPSLGSKMETIHKTLKNILSCTTVPDLEFVLILTDGAVDTISCPGPLFTFSKHQHKNSNCIGIPDSPTLQEHADLKQQTLKGNSLYPWDTKIKQAFWRGDANDPLLNQLSTFKHSPRYKLVTFSQQNPLYVDALFRYVHGCNRIVQKILHRQHMVGSPISIEAHMHYAYQIQIDGHTSAWTRMYWQLFCNSVMLKQDSDNIQWYYAPLKPYVHYIPFNHDTSNIAQQIDWANNHPEEVQQIISNANNFAHEQLTYANMLYYIYLLLNEYAQLQQFTPTLDHTITLNKSTQQTNPHSLYSKIISKNTAHNRSSNTIKTATKIHKKNIRTSSTT